MTIDLLDALRGTGSVRSFTDAPVDDATIAAVLDSARFAPSGGNRQPWRVAVITDVEIRRRMASMMRAVWDEYITAQAAGLTPFQPGVVVPALAADAPRRSNPLIDNIELAPVVLAVACDLGAVAVMDAALDRVSITGGASIYPFCWNLLLAARAHGLGGVLTTFLSRCEPEAGPMLELPANHALAATLFLGYPKHQPTRLRRQPVESFTTLNSFSGPQWTGGRYADAGTSPS
jgi:nitroreductase